MYNDSLFRISFKCVILNKEKSLLVVKERGRASWDLPGGGIEYGETIEESVARELFEEVGFSGAFTYSLLTVDDPVKLLTRDVWQVKVVVLLNTDVQNFRVGEEADAIRFVNPKQFAHSEHESELRMVNYVKRALEKISEDK